MDSVEAQAGSSRQSTTGPKTSTRREWSRRDNMNVMECYYESRPDQERGYIKRMYKIWQEKGLFPTSEQRLADQVRVIKRNELLTEVEREGIRRNVYEPVRDEQEEVLRPGREEQTEATAQFQTELDPTTNRLDEEQEEIKIILLEIKEWVTQGERPTPPNLKRIPREKLLIETQKVNDVMKFISSDSIEDTNDLIYAGAVLVTERLGVRKQENTRKHCLPPWKRRLDNQIKGWRTDLSRLTEINLGKADINDFKYLEEKFSIRRKGRKIVVEELKQRITSTTAKVKRYTDRVSQYRQNSLFENNQKRFYQEINGKMKDEVPPPNPAEAIAFWSNIWSQPHNHNQEAMWLKTTKEECANIVAQDDLTINKSKLEKIIRKMAPWKAAGPDGVQAFWVKRFTNLHERLSMQMNEIVVNGNPPNWMTKGRTVLIPKDPTKGNIPSNYRPITCLPILWKLLTGIISEEIYQHLDDQAILPWEQKGCRKGSRGTKEQLCIDKGIMKDSKKRKTNLAMAWIDYKKAYDMVPHSWIIESMEMLGVADNIRRFLITSMTRWRTKLESNGEVLGEVGIKRGIFQGDSLSPLLFVMAMTPLTKVLRRSRLGYEFKSKAKINHLLYMDDLKLFGKTQSDLESLINTVRIFSEDIGMQFGMDKCAMITLMRGKPANDNNFQMPNGKEIRSIEDGGSYKYLGILEADQLKHQEMKKKIEAEYQWRS
ncbi:uncharacterized protein LOC135154347 [Lytechinus pictus]|uniref:uncharacterized protein LOC135154347 n=1 Tax=Lytechinus pictus TaxID=7653 RepID=UPI0030B9F14C